MPLLLAFLLSIILASIIIPRLGPFLSLIISSLFFGLLSSMGPELLGYIYSGLARMFSSLALVIFGGAVLAEYLRRTESLARIVSDLGRLAKRSLLVSGAAGFLISLPVMCSITAFMILEPVVRALAAKDGASRLAEKRALFMTAVCSVISFNLIYPSPVMITLSTGLQAPHYSLLIRAIPISLALFAFACIIMPHIPLHGGESLPSGLADGGEGAAPSGIKISRLRAWAPLLVPLLLMLAGALIEGGGSGKLSGPEGGGAISPLWALEAIFTDPGLALLLGALLGLAWQRDKMSELIHVASRRSGVILLDLCGAGAFGYVVSRSDLSGEIFRQGHILPVLLLPFLVSAVLQLAQGSRVVTAALAAQILAGYPLPAEILALLIASGAFMLSYVSDPFFWLIKNATGSSLKETAKAYTLPLSLMGLFAFALAAMISVFYN
ncbi:MAG TPA: hypothetical protein PKK11_00840 [Methanothrix sp.]|nr:hypothetical protein [Methanothrix sp.]HPT19208.1 hypothetical protein [Methanothrix sp.]